MLCLMSMKKDTKKYGVHEGFIITSISLDQEWTKLTVNHVKECQHCTEINFVESKKEVMSS